MSFETDSEYYFEVDLNNTAVETFNCRLSIYFPDRTVLHVPEARVAVNTGTNRVAFRDMQFDGDRGKGLPRNVPLDWCFFTKNKDA